MDAENPITPQRIAQWMLEELERRGYLAIGKAVLKAFRKLTEKSVVWDREDRSWRKRKPNDSPSRMQD
jgi:hypothetical protein